MPDRPIIDACVPYHHRTRARRRDRAERLGKIDLPVAADRQICRRLSGTVRSSPRHAFLDQSVSLLDVSETSGTISAGINPQADENACRSALARFMFRADAALLPVSSLSGGQMLRAGLACVLGGDSPPQLLILDEPTNHLDIDSIEAVEAGLARLRRRAARRQSRRDLPRSRSASPAGSTSLSRPAS